MEMFDNTGGANGITRQSRMLGLFIWGDEDKVFYLTPPPWCLDHLDQPNFIVIVFHKQLPGEPRHFSFPCWERRDLVWICLREFVMNEWHSPAERDRESQLIRRWLTPARLRGILTKTLLLRGTRPGEGFFCCSLINAAAGERRREENKDPANYPVKLDQPVRPDGANGVFSNCFCSDLNILANCLRPVLN